VIVWDARTGTLLHRFPAETAGLTTAQWSPDGGSVYAASGRDIEEADQLLEWRVSDLPTLGEDTGPPTGRAGFELALPGPGGRLVARLQAHRLWFVDLASGRATRTPRLPDVWGAKWSPDSRRFLTWGPDGRLRVWDPESGRLLARRSQNTDTLPVSFGPDGTRIYVLDGSGGLETLATDTLRPVSPPVRVGTGVRSLEALPRGGSVLVLRVDGSAARVDPSTGRTLARAPSGTLPPQAENGIFSPDGSVMATSDVTGNLRLLDADSLAWAGPDSGSAWGYDRDYAPDGTQLAAVRTDRIALWDGRTGAYLASLPLPADAGRLSIAYLPDSSGLVVASVDGRTWTVDTRTSTWTERACAIAGRNLTPEEWRRFFPSRPYRATCPS
jgi:WD40 repeat protein